MGLGQDGQVGQKWVIMGPWVAVKGGQGLRCLTRRRGGGVNEKSLKKSTNFDARGKRARSRKGGVTSKGFCTEKRTEIGLYYRMYGSLQ